VLLVCFHAGTFTELIVKPFVTFKGYTPAYMDTNYFYFFTSLESYLVNIG